MLCLKISLTAPDKESDENAAISADDVTVTAGHNQQDSEKLQCTELYLLT